MVFLTADLHGDQMALTAIIQTVQKYPGTKYLFVAGDFGFLLQGNRQEGYFLDDLERVSDIVFLVVPGNHEGYPFIQQYPVERWHGAAVRRVRDNLFYVERGEVLIHENRTIFCFGGAFSRDAVFRRQNGWPWYPQELPTEEAYENSQKALQIHHNCVDYVITHTAPEEVQCALGVEIIAEEAQLNQHLKYILQTVQVKNTWFFGHFHADRELNICGTRFVGVKNRLHRLD